MLWMASWVGYLHFHLGLPYPGKLYLLIWGIMDHSPLTPLIPILFSWPLLCGAISGFPCHTIPLDGPLHENETLGRKIFCMVPWYTRYSSPDLGPQQQWHFLGSRILKRANGGQYNNAAWAARNIRSTCWRSVRGVFGLCWVSCSTPIFFFF